MTDHVLPVEFRVTDMEPFSSFINAVEQSCGHFGSLGEEDIRDLPETVRMGILNLQSAIEVIGRQAGVTDPVPEPQERGSVVIEWPPLPDTKAHPSLAGAPLRGSLLTVQEVTGAGETLPLTGVTRVRFDADAETVLAADVETLVDEHGDPLTEGAEPAVTDRELVTRTFRYFVAGMRIRPPEPCRTCKGSAWVCECHPATPWGGMCCDGPETAPGPPCSGEALCEHGACHCGGAGLACPADGCPGGCGRCAAARAAGHGPATMAAELEPCSLDYPVTREQALGWARQAEWRLKSYYKYEFTFEAYCTVAYPDDPEAHEVQARAVVSGSDGDIYRFSADTETPVTWESLCYLRTPDLVIRENGQTLIEIAGDEAASVVLTVPVGARVSIENHDGSGGCRTATMTVAELLGRPAAPPGQVAFAGLAAEAPGGMDALLGKPGIMLGFGWSHSLAGRGFEDMRREATSLASRLVSDFSPVPARAAVWELPVTEPVFRWWLEPLADEEKAAPFLDFRRVTNPWGNVTGPYDFAGISSGASKSIRFMMGLGTRGGDECVVTASRDAGGVLSVTAEPGEYEPVMEGGKLVGIRFPGCDQFPWQPHDPEQHDADS